MKFTATLNGVKVTKDIPTSWDSVTFGKYMELVEVSGDPIGILSKFVGIDADTLSKVKVVGLDNVLTALSFTRVPPPLHIPKYILGYRVSKDLEFETTGQYKDCQMIVESMRPEGETLLVEDQMKYLDIVAIFAMPNYLEASDEAKAEFAKKFLNAPCGEVLAIGNFTLLKLIGLKLNISPGSLNKIGPLKKLRLAIKIWLKNTAFSLRFAWLRRRLESHGMNS